MTDKTLGYGILLNIKNSNKKSHVEESVNSTGVVVGVGNTV